MRIFKKMLFFVRRTLNRWQTSTNSDNYNFYMFALLEIAHIYKALKHFADLQGHICYNDAQNKGINLIVIRYNREKFAYHFRINSSRFWWNSVQRKAEMRTMCSREIFTK